VSGCGEGRSSGTETRPESPPPASASSSATPQAAAVELSFASFGVAREVYESRLIPEFQSRWRKAAQQELHFGQSYSASGSQARAVANDLEADVVALSLDEEIDLLVRAGKVHEGWKSVHHGGVSAGSIVVFAVRKGNPLGIHDWPDLVRPGLRIVAPDPQTSGAGRWYVSAIYGAALRGQAGVRRGDPAQAQHFLSRVLANVSAEERDAESSFRSFADGRGDVALASESQVNRGRMFGNDYESVIPPSTLRIDNPIAIVDANVDEHGAREVAEAFLEFLMSPEAQRAFAFYGFRPVDPAIAESYAEQFPTPPDLWTIEELGGWGQVSHDLFAAGGVLEDAAHPTAVR
jgi:sulfate transport system substrate-binding protein